MFCYLCLMQQRFHLSVLECAPVAYTVNNNNSFSQVQELLLDIKKTPKFSAWFVFYLFFNCRTQKMLMVSIRNPVKSLLWTSTQLVRHLSEDAKLRQWWGESLALSNSPIEKLLSFLEKKKLFISVKILSTKSFLNYFHSGLKMKTICRGVLESRK